MRLPRPNTLAASAAFAAFASMAQADILLDPVTLACDLNFDCSGGSCRNMDEAFEARITVGNIQFPFDGAPESLVILDRTSGGDLVFGGQLGPQLYGILILKTEGTARLLVEGVNGWSEQRTLMMICREAGKE